MSDEPSCSNVLDPQLPRCAWLLACSVSRKDASPQSSASARRIPVRILSGNGVHRFRNHCSTSPEYALRLSAAFPNHFSWLISCVLGAGPSRCVAFGLPISNLFFAYSLTAQPNAASSGSALRAAWRRVLSVLGLVACPGQT